MAATTGIVLTMGAIVLVNDTLVQKQPLSWKVPLAVGLAALGLSWLEKVDQGLAVGLAYIAFVTAMVTPAGKSKTSPLESVLRFTGFG